MNSRSRRDWSRISAAALGLSLITVAALGADPPQREHAVTPADRVGTLADGLGLAVGARAPDVTLDDLGGQAVHLRDLVARGPILIVFYRGGWCPFCNFQIHELSTSFAELQARGVTPVAISVDLPAEEVSSRDALSIPFPVLSDPGAKALDAFHVIHEVDDAELTRLKDHGIDLEHRTGSTRHAIAVPSMFLVDREGVIRWAHADPDFKTRPSIAQILSAIEAAHLQSAARAAIDGAR